MIKHNDSASTFFISGRLMKAEEREYKSKDGSLKLARTLDFLTEYGEHLSFGYNGIHESFDFESIKTTRDVIGELEVTIYGDKFKYLAPVVQCLAFVRTD